MRSLLLAALLTPAPPLEEITITDAVAVRVQPAPADCGVYLQWAVIEFEHQGRNVRVNVLCGRARELPKQGAHCTVNYHVGTLNTVRVDGKATPMTGNIVDRMTCDPPIGGPRPF